MGKAFLVSAKLVLLFYLLNGQGDMIRKSVVILRKLIQLYLILCFEKCP
jgi:hypothetical protein